MPTSSVRVNPLRFAAVLLALEGLAAGAFGVLVLSQITGERPSFALATGLLLLGYAAVLFALGRGVLRGRRWSRGPAVATQLIHLLTAWSFRQGVTAGVAVAVAVAALVVLVCLLLPTSTLHFTDPPPAE